MPYADPQKRKEYNQNYHRKWWADADNRAKKRKYLSRLDVKKRIRKYYQDYYKKHGRSVEQRKRDNEWIKNWRERYPERVEAERQLNIAVRYRRIMKSEFCSSCQRKKSLHAHHEDYSKPLEVLWLCSSCHKLLHNSRMV